MKRAIKWNVVLITLLSSVWVSYSSAQDVWKVAPNNAKLLCDTLGVKLIEIKLQPGEELAMHTHPAQEVYALKGGQITVNYKNGKTETIEFKTGGAMQFPSDPPHVTKNTGTTPVEIILVEIHKK